jgi:nucleotide-binding universal stress UspA family protein
MSAPVAATSQPAIPTRLPARTQTAQHPALRSGRREHVRRVVVGVDGSSNSIAALRRAIVQARLLAAELDVVHALPDHADEAAASTARAMLRKLIADCLPDGVDIPFRLRVERGDPSTVLLVVSAGAELLIIGARKHSARGNMLGGDTVPRCLDYAPCRVDVCADHHENH